MRSDLAQPPCPSGVRLHGAQFELKAAAEHGIGATVTAALAVSIASMHPSKVYMFRTALKRLTPSANAL